MLSPNMLQDLCDYYKDSLQVSGFDSRTNNAVTNSFLSVLVGLYCPELKKRGDMLKVFFIRRGNTTEGHEVPVIEKFERDSLYLVDYASFPDSQKRIRHDVIYSTQAKDFKFEELKQINAFYQQKKIHDRIVYVDKEHHVSLVFYDKQYMISAEGFAGFLPVILPWIPGFDFNTKDKNNSNREAFQILKSLTVDCSILPIENQIKRVTESKEYKHFVLKEIVSFFPNSSLQQKLGKNEEDYRKLQDEMSKLIESIAFLQRKIDDVLLEREVIKAKTQDSCDDELITFLESNKEIVIENRDGKYIAFGVQTYLDFVDEDLCETYFFKDNAKSHALDEICEDAVLAKRFWRAVWIERKYRIRVFARYKIDDKALVIKNKVNDDFSFGGPKYMDSRYPKRCGSPHTVMFSCFGNYAQQISSASRNHDFIAAFYAAIGITKNLNLADHAVTSFFADWLKQNQNVGIIETENGEIISLGEALHRIKKESE